MTTMAGDSTVFGSGPFPPDSGGRVLPAGVELIRVSAGQRLEAAARLVGDQSDDPYTAGQRFLESAADLRIDLGLMWATAGRGGSLRQVVLVVPGSGRTAMVFISGPPRRRRGMAGSISELGSGPGPARERAAAVDAACRWVARNEEGRTGSLLAQALLEPKEKDAVVALRAAGFTQLGELAYMRRVAGPPPTPRMGDKLPPAVRLVSHADLEARGHGRGAIDAMFVDALERTYIETRDCPELCGLRSALDVLDSHRLVGTFDAGNWWLVMAGERPEGCLLFNVSPEHESVELVYLGLSPALRGQGIGRLLLDIGLRHVLGAADAVTGAASGRCQVGAGGVTCAVDTRNTPAMKLYRGAGFQRFSLRVPMVRSLAE